jgi:hypothetical protein
MLKNESVTMYTAAHYKDLLFASVLEGCVKAKSLSLGLTYSGWTQWTVNSAVFLDIQKCWLLFKLGIP